MVVLVGVIDGPLDDVSRDADVGGVEDKAFAVNDVVVSEVRHSLSVRGAEGSFAGLTANVPEAVIIGKKELNQQELYR